MNVGKLIIACLAANARRGVLSANTASRTMESAVTVKRVSLGVLGGSEPSALRRLIDAVVGRPFLATVIVYW